MAGILLNATAQQTVSGLFRQTTEFHAQFVVDTVVEQELDRLDDAGWDAPALLRAGGTLREYALDGEVVRVLLWHTDGTVAVSDDPALIGLPDRSGADFGSPVAADGLVSTLARDRAAGELLVGVESDQVLHTFVPTGHDAVPVAEIVQDLRPSATAADMVATRLNVATAAGLALLWVVLAPIARRTHRRLAEHHLTDDVTGLPSRAALPALLEDGTQQLRRSGGQLAVLFVDLDGFKRVNDTVGHHVADDALREIAGRLRRLTGPEDGLCRFAGDEFVVITTLAGPTDVADGLAAQVVEAIGSPLPMAPGVRLSASVGLACTSDPSTPPQDLLRQADLAMYRAKDLGGAGHVTYDDELQAVACRRQWVEAALQEAITSEEGLWIAYQPQVDVGHGDDAPVVGAEALLRWDHPGQGAVSPGEFIPIAETAGLICSLGRFVLLQVCTDLARWQDQLDADFRVHVNLSPVQLADAGIVETIDQCLAATGADPSRLGFEITETAILQDGLDVRRTIDALKARGCHVALDDFGTGYSSLSHLRTVSLDLLKIDRSFVDELAHRPRDRAIVAAIAAMAGEMGVSVLAEGVETEAQLAAVRAVGVELVQGYLCGRPESAAVLEARLGLTTAEDGGGEVVHHASATSS